METRIRKTFPYHKNQNSAHVMLRIMGAGGSGEVCGRQTRRAYYLGVKAENQPQAVVVT